MEQYAQYANEEVDKYGVRIVRTLVKPVMNLFHGEPNGKLFRSTMDRLINSTDVCKGPISLGDVIIKASDCLSNEVLDRVGSTAASTTTATPAAGV